MVSRTDRLLRRVELAALDVAAPAPVWRDVWRDVWNILGWKACDAAAAPEGYDPDNRLIIDVRPSPLTPKRRADCIAAAARYAIDPETGAARQVDESTVLRAAEIMRHPDLTICPMTAEQPGAMQMVCVESAENIRLEKLAPGP